jgi:hypothetical protein
MFRNRAMRIALGLCLIPASLAIASVAMASGPTFTGPSSSLPTGTVTYGPTGSGGVSPDSTWSCAVTMSNATFHAGIGTHGAVLVYGAQICTGTGYANERVGTSIWDDANDTLVAGWNYSDWTSDSSSDKNSELLCTNNTDSFEFSGIGEGEAVSGADFQYVTSLDPEIITCGY